MIIQLSYPLETCSEANIREHWSKSSKRHKRQKMVTHVELLANKIPKKLPVRITLSRLSPRNLDSDNLQSSLKYIRDAVADYFIPGLQPGRADDNEGFTWEYSQEKSKERGVKLTFQY